MKGLLVKDFKLLTSGGNYFAMVSALAFFEVLCVLIGGEVFSDLSQGSMVIAALAVETKIYDFYDNGMAYLLTLPVSRRKYVRESYLFTILHAVALMLVFNIMNIAAMVLKGSKTQAYLDFLSDRWKSFGIILLIIALVIPFYIRFGVKKSSYIAVISTMLIAVGVLFVLFFALDEGMTLAVVLQKGMKILAGFPVVLLVLAGSYVLSVVLMERKDF